MEPELPVRIRALPTLPGDSLMAKR